MMVLYSVAHHRVDMHIIPVHSLESVLYGRWGMRSSQ